MTIVATETRAREVRVGAADARSAGLGRCFLVINPGSRNGQSRRIAEEYKALLSGTADGRQPVEFDCGYTGEMEDARRLAREAIEAGYDTIVAIGGDGTINRVLSALGERRSGERESAAGGSAKRLPAERCPRLGILYSGTSPDFCRFHGIPIEPVAAVQALRAGLARPIDICRIEHGGEAGEARVDYFASSANIGLGAGIAAGANRLRPRLGDFLGTLAASIQTIARHGPQHVRLTIDGREVAIPPALNISVGKNPHLASGLKLDVDIKPDDGALFVFAICGVRRGELLRLLPRIYDGSIARDPRFLLRRASVVRIEPLDSTWRTEFDGDPAGWCPAEITVLAGAVQLIGAGR
jgi:diacylglycerol kinase family enzyme